MAGFEVTIEDVIGVPDLLLASWVIGRDTSVQVFGPEGTSAFIESIFETFKLDIQERQSQRKNRPQALPKDIDVGWAWETAHCKIRAVRVDHILNSLAYRIDTDDRSIVYSGDTRPCPALVDFARGADLLIHEVFFSPEFESKGVLYGRHSGFLSPDSINPNPLFPSFDKLRTGLRQAQDERTWC
jgi:ribonuclease BN (tRNA processing enzyme)